MKSYGGAFEEMYCLKPIRGRPLGPNIYLNGRYYVKEEWMREYVKEL